MKRFILIIIALLLLLVAGLVGLFGLGQFGGAIRQVVTLPQDERELATLRLYEAGGPGGYSGILAGVSPNGSVWVWGKRGLKYLRVDEHSVYTNFVICTPENIEALEEGGSIETMNFVTSDVAQWRGRARVGDYVTVEATREGMGGTLGVAREIKAHDWWAFIPKIDLRKACAR